MGQNKSLFAHYYNKTYFWTEQGDFLGGEVDFGSLQDESWDIMMCFFGTGEVDRLVWAKKCH